MAGIGDLRKAGYSFFGWLIDNTIYWPGATYVMPEKNVTAYAIWSDHAGLQKKGGLQQQRPYRRITAQRYRI